MATTQFVDRTNDILLKSICDLGIPRDLASHCVGWATFEEVALLVEVLPADEIYYLLLEGRPSQSVQQLLANKKYEEQTDESEFVESEFVESEFGDGDEDSWFGVTVVEYLNARDKYPNARLFRASADWEPWADKYNAEVHELWQQLRNSNFCFDHPIHTLVPLEIFLKMGIGLDEAVFWTDFFYWADVQERDLDAFTEFILIRDPSTRLFTDPYTAHSFEVAEWRSDRTKEEATHFWRCVRLGRNILAEFELSLSYESYCLIQCIAEFAHDSNFVEQSLRRLLREPKACLDFFSDTEFKGKIEHRKLIDVLTRAIDAGNLRLLSDTFELLDEEWLLPDGWITLMHDHIDLQDPHSIAKLCDPTVLDLWNVVIKLRN